MFASRAPSRLLRFARTAALQTTQKRSMGGGSHPPFTVSEWHTKGGEAIGFVMWMWIFYRAKQDLPVVLGLRHPWDHVEGDDHHDAAHEDAHFAYLHETWDKHDADTLKVRDDDDDDDEDEDEEDEE
uniref:Uncharacterized protein n=1 Tax=Leptocylindrus danicus TaxID=163516 RepID=A0A7S2KLZ2_9STRA|mmetsp:Transcript_23460/g.35207  ORF Transcript_23460/g.35207 Transcript_23460/m.35207 type:complete len:127 (+) Transcript_23460:68-448(+)